VLDVGAGTGRVALDLARRGHAVVALDADDALLAALRARAGGLPVETVHADARTFALDRAFGLILVPMQTAQILGGPSARAALLGRARAHLRPGGLLALAIADPIDGSVEAEEWTQPPPPDACEIGGVRYASHAVAVADEGPFTALERIREVVGPDGERRAEHNVVRLDRVVAADLEEEGRAAGLTVEPRRAIPWTDEYVGSDVVMLRG
jgi:SAM-dependent methyltransferase